MALLSAPFAIENDFIDCICKQIAKAQDCIRPDVTEAVLRPFFFEQYQAFYLANLKDFSIYAQLSLDERRALVARFEGHLNEKSVQESFKTFVSNISPNHFIQILPTSQQQSPLRLVMAFLKNPLPQQVPYLPLRSTINATLKQGKKQQVSLFRVFVSERETHSFRALETLLTNMTPEQWEQIDFNELVEGRRTFIVLMGTWKNPSSKEDKLELVQSKMRIMNILLTNMTESQCANVIFDEYSETILASLLDCIAFFNRLYMKHIYDEYLNMRERATRTLYFFTNKMPMSLWRHVSLDDKESKNHAKMLLAKMGYKSFLQALLDVAKNVRDVDLLLSVMKKISKSQIEALDLCQGKDSLWHHAMERHKLNQTELLDCLMRRCTATQLGKIVLSWLDLENLKTARWLKYHELCRYICDFLNAPLDKKSDYIEGLFEKANHCAEEDGHVKAHLLVAEAFTTVTDYHLAKKAYKNYLKCAAVGRDEVHIQIASFYMSGFLTTLEAIKANPDIARKRALLKAYEHTKMLHKKNPARETMQNQLLTLLFYGNTDVDEEKGELIPNTIMYDAVQHPLVAEYRRTEDPEAWFLVSQRPATLVPMARVKAAAPNKRKPEESVERLEEITRVRPK